MFVVPSYSPLFTMGLLAERSPVDPDPICSPVDSSPSNPDDASAFYFTLQAGKRDTLELRSFLYLDLADHKWHAQSHRRKGSTLSKSTSWTCSPDAKSIHDFARSEKLTNAVVSHTPVVQARRRASKESLRSMPSPKPAPSATLPDLPLAPHPTPPSSASPRVPSRKCSRSTVKSLPSPTRRSFSLRAESLSSHDRRKSHMDALACLEGRSRAPYRVPRSSTLRNNFMSFSDDEDEKSLSRKSTLSKQLAAPLVHSEDPSAFADVEDEVDAIVPNLVRKRGAVDLADPVRTVQPGRKRRSTVESWFPLKSFIDLKDDDLSSWNWRSFIEIGGVA